MKSILSLSARWSALSAGIVLGGMFVVVGRATATSYYYDADGTGGGAALNYGAGIWSTTSPLWLNGTAGTAGGTYSGWTNLTTDSALIGASSGYTAATAPFTITLGENIIAGSVGVSGNVTQNLTISGSASNYTLTIGNGGFGANQTTSGVTILDAVLTGSTVFTKFNSGTLILTQTNTYTSGTNVEGGSNNTVGGTLQVGNGGTAGALGTGAISFVLFGSGATLQNRASTLSFNRSDAITVGSSVNLNSANTLGGTIQQAGGNKLTMTANVTLGTTAANTGVLTYNIGRTTTIAVDTEVSGNITAGGSITKTGAGVLQFSGTNTYTGATAVGGGTLLVTGNSSAATGAVSVTNSGTILGGTGTVGGAVTVNSGAILQGGTGAATGTLTLTATPVLNAGSVIGLTLGAGNTHSTIALSTIGFNGFQAGQSFTLGGLQAGTYDNIITGVAGGITTTGWTVTNGSGYTFSFVDDGSNIDLTVAAAAVPEPSTWMAGLLCVGVAALVLRRRTARS